MIYILRLTNGNCVVAMASDERGARQIATQFATLDELAEVATIRRLDSFGVQFSPTEDGSLDVAHWDDATLDSILAHEYPLLNEACQRANAAPFFPAPNPAEPPISQLKSAYERNIDIIREGLRRELQRSSQQSPAKEPTTKMKAATSRR